MSHLQSPAALILVVADTSAADLEAAGTVIMIAVRAAAAAVARDSDCHLASDRDSNAYSTQPGSRVRLAAALRLLA